MPRPSEEVDPWWTTARVAALFDVTAETVRNWIDAGKIPATKINGYWRVRRSDAIAYGNQRYGVQSAD